MAKVGRPRKEDAKRVPYRLRLSQRESAAVELYCESTGQTKAEAIRKAIMDAIDEFYKKGE